MSNTVIKGGCHCGNVRFELHWPDEAIRIAARQCGCTYCETRGATWTSHPDATFVAEIGNKDQVTPYRFGTRTADFHVCANCGVVPFVTSEIGGRVYAVVNIVAFEDKNSCSFESSRTDFDGEDRDSRLARRQRNWINEVLL